MLNKAMPAGRQGFTLIEVVVAVFIMTLGVGSAYILVNQTSASSRFVSSKLTASYLAQEGIEIVRNIRDSNFLKIHKGVSGVNWDTGIASSGWQPVIFMDGTQSNFQRKITIAPSADVLNVSVEVSWQDKGITHKVTAQELLYQWLK